VLYLDVISNQFITLYKIHKGIKGVSFVSVVALKDESRLLLKEILRSELNAEIELEEKIDPRIIGGFIVQVDDRRYDASLRSKLNKLDRQYYINIYKKGF
jgi:F-type H+-transporting ATPase subunit delta